MFYDHIQGETMGFTESEVYHRLEHSLTDIFNFSKEDLLVFKGVTTDTGRLYNEVAAGFVYDNLKAFKSVRKHRRFESYNTEQYKQFSRDQSNLNTEKQLNLRLFKQCSFAVGKIIDAQTPVFRDAKHKYLGKVGNLLYTEADELFLINVKLPQSEQTILRHIVELLLMYQLIDKQKLLIDFSLPEFAEVKIAPLLFKDASPHNELKQDRPKLYQLMAMLDLTVFIMHKSKGKYIISRQKYHDFGRSLDVTVKENEREQ